VCEPEHVQPTEIIRQYTGDQSIKEPTATRRMSHWLLRELSGASFAVVARNGCNEETSRADWFFVESLREESFYRWALHLREYVSGVRQDPPEIVTQIPDRTLPPYWPDMITEWLPDTDHKWRSQYGWVTNMEWCLRESERAQAKAAKAFGHVCVLRGGIQDLKYGHIYVL